MRGFSVEVVANASMGQPDSKKKKKKRLQDQLKDYQRESAPCTREVIVSIEFKEQMPFCSWSLERVVGAWKTRWHRGSSRIHSRT
ncbi:hypothetical protein CY34DRAFT_423481 [Suillus luteus UH-Slu-Lm8-n1]|uniref:Uncharacterized protein n=1 Tax=Suillus luteus UH-Slu-Lm8-n1 TaxID=930992 RepID=A0A0D0AU88_9AGAM|nr:hypothetical protein CY34DRAFT_423481 [Suillus luteus UH-Slu-Lm8-n1]